MSTLANFQKKLFSHKYLESHYFSQDSYLLTTGKVEIAEEPVNQ